MVTPAKPPAPPRPASSTALDRLKAIAESVPDRAFAGRLLKVWMAADKAIGGLGELDLGRYEDLSESGCPDLSMWEELAPVIRDTVMDVNVLLSTVRELFPSVMAGGLEDLIGEAIHEAAGGGVEALAERRKEDVTEHIQALANALAAEITNLGERMRSPQVVSDRWNLLGDLQEFRGKFRNSIGDMVFLSASAFAPVSREDVIPGYAEEVRESIAGRRVVTDLARLMAAHHARLRKSVGSTDLRPLLEALVKDLDIFGRSRSYVVLRTDDKRRFVEFRALLQRLRGEPAASTVVSAVGDFAQFAQGLSHINRRACLVERDNRTFASCGVQLEKVDGLRAASVPEAAKLLSETVKAAQDLYGRSVSLDTYLRQAKKRDLTALSAAELELELDLLRGVIATAMIG